jgi:hypothetical protein
MTAARLRTLERAGIHAVPRYSTVECGPIGKTVRSFEKLTAGGMTFLDVDVARVLDQLIVGRPTSEARGQDVLETEGQDGRPRLRLLVHPSVGAIDSATVMSALLEALAGTGGAERVMALQWQLAGWLEVERRPPHLTGGGKILHLH